MAIDGMTGPETPPLGRCCSASRAEDRLEPLQAGGRPELLRVVVDLERRHALGERHPGQLRLRVDVDVGATADGSSSVPPRTNLIAGAPYSLKTATWQAGQR